MKAATLSLTDATSDTVPEYVDTKTPQRRWLAYNLFILIASLAMATVAVYVMEYEIAKLTHPGVVFIATPVYLDLVVGSLVVALAFANVSILLFVFLRHLWLRKWMLATTIIGWMLLAVLGLVLNGRLLMILDPWYGRLPL